MLTHEVDDSGRIAVRAFEIGKGDLVNRSGQTIDERAVKGVVECIMERASDNVVVVQIEDFIWTAAHDAGIGKSA